MNNILELCICGCTKQVHELAKGKCGNPECKGTQDEIECTEFRGTGELHDSAFCLECGIQKEACFCEILREEI